MAGRAGRGVRARPAAPGAAPAAPERRIGSWNEAAPADAGAARWM